MSLKMLPAVLLVAATMIAITAMPAFAAFGGGSATNCQPVDSSGFRDCSGGGGNGGNDPDYGGLGGGYGFHSTQNPDEDNPLTYMGGGGFGGGENVNSGGFGTHCVDYFDCVGGGGGEYLAP